ncbi:MAG: hypothetical protein AAFZ15_33720 [Bacteroidota bacterium]
MIKYILSLSFLVLSAGILSAHSPKYSSTILKEQKNNEWILVVQAPLNALQYEISTHFGQSAFSTPVEFQELVINHLKENISILINERKAVALQKGRVKLGHESSVVFQMVNMPDDVSLLIVKNSSFENIHKNESTLVILKDGFAENKFTLNNENQHTAELTVKGNQFIQYAETASSKFPSHIWLLAGLLMLALGTVLVYRINNGAYSFQ